MRPLTVLRDCVCIVHIQDMSLNVKRQAVDKRSLDGLSESFLVYISFYHLFSLSTSRTHNLLVMM